jgi:hypothetical protein
MSSPVSSTEGSVGRGARGGGVAERAARSGSAVVDHHRLAQNLFQCSGDRPCGQIRLPARREGDDGGNRPIGPGFLRAGAQSLQAGLRRERQGDAAFEKISPIESHCQSPGRQ